MNRGVWLLVLGCTIPYAADNGTVEMNVVIHHYEDAEALSIQDAKRIVGEMQRLLCGACKLAQTKRAPCSFQLRPPARITETRNKSGGLRQADVEKVQNRHRNRPREDRTLHVHVVNAIEECGTHRPQQGQLIPGCAEQRDFPSLANTIIVVLYPPVPPGAGRHASWVAKQAEIWLHEIGHGVGLPHQGGTIMTEVGSSLRITPEQCEKFRRWGDPIWAGYQSVQRDGLRQRVYNGR